MIDAEYERLIDEMKLANNFKDVLNLHKAFISSIVRLSMVDNTIVQDALDKVIHTCLRFVGISELQQKLSKQNAETNANTNIHRKISSSVKGKKLLKQGSKDQEDSKVIDEQRKKLYPSTSIPPTTPSNIPMEEIEDVRREFYAQSLHLFQIMKKVENRGLIFRMDFNNFMSDMSNQSDYLAGSNKSR